jgi:hypothetical protein
LDANQPVCWGDIGVDNPEASAQRFFDYEVNIDATSSLFCAVARRRSVNPAGNPNSTNTVCLDETSAYFGNHPNGPNPVLATAGGCFGITDCG